MKAVIRLGRAQKSLEHGEYDTAKSGFWSGLARIEELKRRY
jgi:hypothetical protein